MSDPKCPFCVENGKVQILHENETAYIVAALGNDRQPMPNHYLIIPKVHAESILDLPAIWQASLNELLRYLIVTRAKPGVSFNLSYNQGREAGQRVSHVHAWIIFRGDESGTPSHELGLATLLERMNYTHKS